MIIYLLQHVSYEGPGAIASWASKNHHTLRTCSLFSGDSAPCFSRDINFLIVMGGPMSVYDADRFNWLEPERNLIRQCVANKVPVLGICLGAQQLAAAMGDTVTHSPETEIGWMPVALSEGAGAIYPFSTWPNIFPAFHWHGDMAEPSERARLLAASAGCPVQAFVYGNNAVGLQFHLEATKDSVSRLIANTPDLPTEKAFIQTPEQMLTLSESAPKRANKLLNTLLDHLITTSPNFSIR
jgi:GMP synthase (glutamine-hydrolysing)